MPYRYTMGVTRRILDCGRPHKLKGELSNRVDLLNRVDPDLLTSEFLDREYDIKKHYRLSKI